MEDTIEVCTGCGKMPRAMDRSSGAFQCSRCGNRATMSVNTENYEKVATELDAKFHSATQKKRVEDAATHPVDMKPSRKKAKAVSRKKPANSKKPKKGAKKR
ncbi:MAG: hypothetical protein AB1324_06650 [Candidatus Micrarchaeota archaeon]